MRPIRNSAKAIIIHRGKLLALEMRDSEGPWFQLPGGGQQPGETLHQALRRECQEEVNAQIEIGDLRLIREYIGRNHEFAAEDAQGHQVEFMFECSVLNPGEMRAGHEPDTGQLGISWLEISRLEEFRLYPMTIRQPIKKNSGARRRFIWAM
jgi:ADP-ribose pyrophosphatase YjhB (NUDIX family)